MTDGGEKRDRRGGRGTRGGGSGVDGDGPVDAAGRGTRDGADVDASVDPGEWSTATFDEVRRLYGRARFDPDDVDPSVLLAALAGTDRYRLTVAEAVEAYAGHDPGGLADRRDRIAETMDEDPDVARPLGRAAGRLAGIDPGAVGDLVDRYRGPCPSAAAEGLAIAADLAPAAVAPELSSLVAGLEADDTVREPTIRALARLYATDPGGRGTVRLSIRDLLESGDPKRRGGGARAICLAAADGDPAAMDLVPAAVTLLDRPLGGWSSVVADRNFGVVLTRNAARRTVREDVLAGLEAIAGSRPGRLADHVGSVLESAPSTERAERVLGRVAAADPLVFETLLDRFERGGVVDQFRGGFGVDEGLVGEALVEAAPDRVEILHERLETVRHLVHRHQGVGYGLVEALARERPGAVEWAVSPLLANVDRSWASIVAAERAFEALGALASTYPTVPETLTHRLRTREHDEWAAAVAAVRGVASVAPEALAGTETDDGAPVESLLVDALSSGSVVDALSFGPVGDEAAFALAHIGIRDPERVVRAGPAVLDAVRSGAGSAGDSDDRATYVLASVVARGDPEGTRPIGHTSLDRLQDTSREGISDGVVLLLGALCAEHDLYAGEVVETMESAAPGERTAPLRVLAEGAWSPGTAVAGYRPELAAATRTGEADRRAVATKALSSTVGQGSSPVRAVVDRLVELLSDPDPAVRRWAAFGVGECLHAGASAESAPERLAALAREDDRRPAAGLALVRAGEWRARERLDALERAARLEYRAIARTAVAELASVERAGAPERLRAIRDGHLDPWVRAAAAEADEGPDRR